MEYELQKISDAKVIERLNDELMTSFETNLTTVNRGLVTLDANTNGMILKTDDAVSTVISQISRTIQGNETKIVAKNTDKLYRLTDNKGAQLMHKLTNSEVGQLAMYKGKKGKILGQARLHKVNPTDYVKSVPTVKANAAKITAASMQLGSVVVGQYYMNEISAKLDGIAINTQEIMAFQQDELIAKIKTRREELERILIYKSELLMDEPSRNRIWNQLETIDSNLHEYNNFANEKLHKLVDEGSLRQNRKLKRAQMQLEKINKWTSINVYTLNLIALTAELRMLFMPETGSRGFVNDSIGTQLNKFHDTKILIQDYLLSIDAQFKIADRNSEKRVKKLSEKLQILPFTDRLKTIIKPVDERLDYGLDFEASDARIESISALINQIVKTEPIRSKVMLIDNDMHQDKHILIDNGQAYYVRQV